MAKTCDMYCFEKGPEIKQIKVTISEEKSKKSRINSCLRGSVVEQLCDSGMPRKIYSGPEHLTQKKKAQ